MNPSNSAAPLRTSSNAARSAFLAAGSAITSEARAANLLAHQVRTKRLADPWPRQSYLELGALHSAVPCARMHARQILWEWGLAAVEDDMELLVSELTTNAVQASQRLVQTPPIRLWLVSDYLRVVVSVWDANPEPPPVPRAGPEDAEGGRGLLIVDALTTEWGWFVPEAMGGKCVWAYVACRQG